MTYADGIASVDASSDDEKPVVAVDTWLTQAEVKTTFECQEVTSNGYTYPRSILWVFVLHLYSGHVLCFTLLHTLCFNGRFSGEPGSAGFSLVFGSRPSAK